MQAGNCLSLLELFKVLWAERWKWHSHYWSFLLLIYCRETLALCTFTECGIWVIYEHFVRCMFIFSCELCCCLYLNVFGVYRHNSPKNGNSVTCSHAIPNFVSVEHIEDIFKNVLVTMTVLRYFSKQPPLFSEVLSIKLDHTYSGMYLQYFKVLWTFPVNQKGM